MSVLRYWEPIWPSPSKCAGLDTQMSLRSGPQSCTDTSSQIPICSIIILGWRKLQSVRERTKQLCLVGGHFYFSTRGSRTIQNFNLKELTQYVYINYLVHTYIYTTRFKPLS